MSSLSKREKVLLLILFSLAFGFFYFKYAATPLLEKYNSEKSLFESNKLKLNTLRETKNNIEKIKKQSQELNNQISDLAKVIPDSGKVPQIIVDIKSMTDSSGCKAVRMYFGNSNNSVNNQSGQNNKNANTQNNVGVLTPIPIGYEVNGDYNSIMSLLGKLENSSRKMIVDKLSVIKDDKTGILSANMTINAYFLNKNEVFKPVEYPFINSNTGKYNIFN